MKIRETASIEDSCAKLDALDLWDVIGPYNFAFKLKRSVVPYFCVVGKPVDKSLKIRLMFLEGWQTLHDFVRFRVDSAYGCYSTTCEFRHFEVIIAANGTVFTFRHDPIYSPVELDKKDKDVVAKLLWQLYGIMLRMESDPRLPMQFADGKALFARFETENGDWRDGPMEIPPPQPYEENIGFATEMLKKAKDMPIVADFSLAIDLRIRIDRATNELKRRNVFELVIADNKTGAILVNKFTSPVVDGGLKRLWEEFPAQVLAELMAMGKVPGEIHVISARVFRLLRALTFELPFKLSLHDSLPILKLDLTK